MGRIMSRPRPDSVVIDTRLVEAWATSDVLMYRICAHIAQLMLTGDLPPGERLPTHDMVVRAIGVDPCPETYAQARAHLAARQYAYVGTGWLLRVGGSRSRHDGMYLSNGVPPPPAP